jgi:DNA-binding NtrC family response regulator
MAKHPEGVDQCVDDSACDVLIVEDDELQAGELADFLAREGLKVRVHHDSSTGLHAIAMFRPCVAVLDYNLPGLNGAQIAERIGAVSPSTAVVLMSGLIVSPTAIASSGACSFHKKPVSLHAVHKTVRELIRARGSAGPGFN